MKNISQKISVSLKAALAGCLLLTAVGCGRSPEASSQTPAQTGDAAATATAPAVDPARNNVSGSCGRQVVSDYMTFVSRCKYLTGYSSGVEFADCKSTAKSFLVKYPEINCSALASDSTSVDGTNVQLTAKPIQDLVAAITKAGY